MLSNRLSALCNLNMALTPFPALAFLNPCMLPVRSHEPACPSRNGSWRYRLGWPLCAQLTTAYSMASVTIDHHGINCCALAHG